MPRYYFNAYDGTDVFDEVGTELANMPAVHNHMLFYAIEMMGHEKNRQDDWQMEAIDEDGKIVATLQFSLEPLKTRGGRDEFS